MKKPKLPQSDSIQELAEFWDTHDLTDFEGELEEVPEPLSETSFMTEMEQMQSQLAEALDRIQHLEEEVSRVKELPRWQYLIARPHRWRRQLSIKGRNMTVGHLVSTIRANRYTPERASEELELPLAAIYEALAYYAEHRDLIEMEASEERRRLGERGYPLD